MRMPGLVYKEDFQIPMRNRCFKCSQTVWPSCSVRMPQRISTMPKHMDGVSFSWSSRMDSRAQKMPSVDRIRAHRTGEMR